MTALKDLIKMKHNAMKAKHPNVPDHAIPPAKYKQDANGLTRAIIDFLKLSGHQAERISTTGRWIKNDFSLNRGEWIPGTSTKGSADISCIINKPNLEYGIPLKIEIKYGKDRQSEHQIKYQQDIEKAGGQYWIARDFDSFVIQYNQFIQTL